MGSPTCPTCKGPLREVRNTSAYLNDDQASSQRAGDFYCEKCPPNGRSNANRWCYWWAREVTTPSAPADDAREKGLAAYDALNMREKSEIAAQDPRYCYAKGYVAALAGRADDASGAEAMREACAKACRDRSRSLYDGKQMAAGLEAAKCADMIDALPLPARDDAVEEARNALVDAVDLYCIGIRSPALRGKEHDAGHVERFGVLLNKWKALDALRHKKENSNG